MLKRVSSLLCLMMITSVVGDELSHTFKSPSFSGAGISAHYLTIEKTRFKKRLIRHY
jgi:hypothetical protein